MTLKEIRRSKGISQTFVANYMTKLGFKMTKSKLCDRESGKIRFTAKELQALCLLYEVSVADVDLL